MLFERELAKNVHAHVISCDQFKNVTMQAIMMLPVEKSSPEMFVLSFILDDVCFKYQTKQEVANALDMLYGASFEVCEKVRGNADMLEFTLSCIDGNYVFEKDLLEKQIDLFYAFMLEPLVIGHRFEPHVFKEACEKAITATQLVLDDESSYVFERTNRLYGGLFAKRCVFTKEQLTQVKNEDVYRCYRELIEQSIIDIFVMGNVDHEKVFDLIASKYAWKDRTGSYQLFTKRFKKDKVYQKEEKNVSVCATCLLYETGLYYEDPLLPAMMIGNGILGALPTSLLFQKIREEDGLCYTIESEHLVEDGILRIYFESDKEEIDRIIEKIETIILQCQNGEIDEDLLEMTKMSYKDSWQKVKDSQVSTIQDAYVNTVLNRKDLISDMLQSFDLVDQKLVQKAFQNLTCKVEYRLLAKECE